VGSAVEVENAAVSKMPCRESENAVSAQADSKRPERSILG